MSSSTSHSCLSMPPPLKSPLRFVVSRFEALFPPQTSSFIVRSFRYYHPRASVMLPSPPSPDLRCARSGHELVRLRAPRGHAGGGAPLERVRSRDPSPAAECRRTRRRARARAPAQVAPQCRSDSSSRRACSRGRRPWSSPRKRSRSRRAACPSSRERACACAVRDIRHGC